MNLHFFLQSPRMFFYGVLLATAKMWPSVPYLKAYYFLLYGKKLNLKNPSTFNEKLNWMKVYYHNNEFRKLADKYEVKDYVRQMIGDEYVVPNYGVWNSFDEIDFDKLPETFVLKGTHDSGGACICENKKTFDYIILKQLVRINE